MNKKLIALAVAGATFAPAVMAQSANPVTLYGRVWVMVNSIKADGGPTPLGSRNTVVDESSLLGVRGTEDLGGGLKAFFQVESSVSPDAGAASATLGSRNSGVGLQGDFGTVILGRWDSPFKLSAIFVDPSGQNTIVNQLSVINTGSFNRREDNSIQYWTPNYSGVSARFMYGANEGKTATTTPSSTGFSVDYASGPFRVNYSQQRHKDQLAAVVTAGVTQKGQNLAGTFSFGPIKVGLLTQKIETSTSVAANARTERKANFMALTYTFGNNSLFATYGRSRNGAAPSTTVIQPESKLAGIGYDYNFSKRTTFMARYASLKNNATSAAPMNASGLPTFAAGNDPKGFGAGFRHTF